MYSPDYVPVHHRLLRAEVLIVEGLAHLERLESEHVFFVALTLRIRGRDGSHCRAIAVDGMSEKGAGRPLRNTGHRGAAWFLGVSLYKKLGHEGRKGMHRSSRSLR